MNEQAVHIFAIMPIVSIQQNWRDTYRTRAKHVVNIRITDMDRKAVDADTPS